MRVLRFPCPLYQFRVSLRDVRPEIWRRILLRSDVSLARFHKVLQALMGWYDYHLYQFKIGEKIHAPPSEEDDEHGRRQSVRIELSTVLGKGIDSFLYEYDFGERVLDCMKGTDRLTASLIYGAGLRLEECLSLRVKDVDFGRSCLTIRRGKGDKDRETVLPERLVGALKDHLNAVRLLYDSDRDKDTPGVELPGALGQKFSSARKEWDGSGCSPRRSSPFTRDRERYADTTGTRRASRTLSSSPSPAPAS